MVGGVKCSFCIILRLNTLVTGYQATVSVKVICGPTSIASYTRRSMNPDATKLVVITCLNAITCHCWLLMLSQTYVSGVLCTSFRQLSTLSYTYSAALTHEIQYTHGTFISNPSLTDLSICTAFLWEY